MNEEVLKKALSGDKKAFSQVYSCYFDDLWRWVYSRIKNKDITSDIISDSFIALYENIRNIRHPKALKSYLYKITKNRMIKFYAEEKPVSLSVFDLDRLEVSDSEIVEQNSNEVEGQISREADKQRNRELDNQVNNDEYEGTNFVRLEEVLKSLPEIYEEVLRLRFIAGMKIKEVAEILGKTENNVKVIQNRAIRKSKQLVFKLYNIKC
ncbi:MAG: RNA polymerase sigma factor [Candidatus Dojkabacteria bacterium]|nr:RNA polymerase sigma factor [Candidatus Dojkabacteria bacterium]